MTEHRSVMFVCDGLPNGGAERQLALLASGLPTSWRSMVVSLADGPFAGFMRSRGMDVRVLSRRARYDPSPLWRLWDAIRALKPDVVHTWGWMGSWAVLPACRAMAIPVVNGTIRTGGPAIRWPRVSRAAALLADRAVANTAVGLAAWELPAAKGAVVRNGFDFDRLACCNGTPKESGTGVVAVMTARMFAQKDYVSFLCAAEALEERLSGAFRFLAVGDGPLRDGLRAEFRWLEERGALRFVSPGLEVMPIVASAHVGVLMTDVRVANEGLSNSIMEYMACGLPVICSNSGGNRELVLDGHTGFIVAPGDCRALVDRLVWIAQNRNLAERIGGHGKARLERDFSRQTMVEAYVRLYEELLSLRTKTRPQTH